MINRILLISFFVFQFNLFGQNRWTAFELQSASTLENIDFLSDSEKEVILYINLARMYPKKFIDCELKRKQLGIMYYLPPDSVQYLQTLIQTLSTLQPRKPLLFDMDMYKLAKCYTNELGKSGRRGHERLNCDEGYLAECIGYRFGQGIDIALQLLIDYGVPKLGHRKICLSEKYNTVGVSCDEHLVSKRICVLDFH